MKKCSRCKEVLGLEKFSKSHHYCKTCHNKFYLDSYYKNKQEIVCECGKLIKKFTYNQHTKSKKHIKIIEDLNRNDNNDIEKYIITDLSILA